MLIFESNNFGKNSQRKPQGRTDEVIKQLYVSKSIPEVGFNFTLYQKICNNHLVTSGPDLRTHTCFNL